jgi:hypothetical protein
MANGYEPLVTQYAPNRWDQFMDEFGLQVNGLKLT